MNFTGWIDAGAFLAAILAFLAFKRPAPAAGRLESFLDSVFCARTLLAVPLLALSMTIFLRLDAASALGPVGGLVLLGSALAVLAYAGSLAMRQAA